FVYTVLTKPDGAVGLYDDRRISHYSNEEQNWKKDSSDAEEPQDSEDWLTNLASTLVNCTSSRCD
ncbi:hypothetical protein M9458_039157, partial [Cirrhinus mrigala]